MLKAKIKILLRRQGREYNQLPVVKLEAHSRLAGKKASEWLRKLNDILTENAHIAQFSVSDMADAMGCSERTLQRNLKSMLSFTPAEYLLTFRINQAVELLKQGGGSIESISQQCGFRSASTFSTVFKKVYGKSPTEWLKQFETA